MDKMINRDLNKQFKTFLKKKESYFTTVEEQEGYQFNVQGINDHIDNVLKLIFGTSELTEDQLKYRQNLLRSLTEDHKESDEQDQRIDIQDYSRFSGDNKFDAVLESYLARSLN